MSSPAILIIDDEPDIRELLAMTVRRMGLDAFCAESLDGARRMLEKRRFDFCLTDMKLPDGTGLQLIEHVQQHHDRARELQTQLGATTNAATGTAPVAGQGGSTGG